MAEVEHTIGFVAVTGTFGCVTLGIICLTIYKVVKVVRETSLKTRLVEAGFSAVEIEMILSAGSGTHKQAPAEKPIPPKAAAYT